MTLEQSATTSDVATDGNDMDDNDDLSDDESYSEDSGLDSSTDDNELSTCDLFVLIT